MHLQAFNAKVLLQCPLVNIPKHGSAQVFSIFKSASFVSKHSIVYLVISSEKGYPEALQQNLFQCCISFFDPFFRNLFFLGGRGRSFVHFTYLENINFLIAGVVFSGCVLTFYSALLPIPVFTFFPPRTL